MPPQTLFFSCTDCIAKSRFFLVLFAGLLGGSFAVPAHAQVSVTEIMYDVSGSDEGREWIEVLNSGASTDLSTMKFFEGGKYHELSVVKGNAVLGGGTRAIIANDGNKFLIDYPSFVGTLFDSSFSLSNTTETIGIATSDKAAVDTVTYTSSQGGAGDGNSLQKVAGVWRGASPTPGSVEGESSGATSATSAVATTPSVAESSVSAQAQSGGGSPVSNQQITADAGAASRTVFAGAPVVFEGRAFGFKKEPIEQARFVWSFGDASVAEGRTVEHLYYYPGEYTAVLDVASGQYSAVDRVHVMVVAPDFVLQTGGDATRSFISVQNKSTSEIDMSGWQLGSGGKFFVIPKNTIIGPQKIGTFPSEVTGLQTPAGSNVVLNYPNGSRVVLSGGSETQKPTTAPREPVGAPLVHAEPPVVIKNVKVVVPPQAPMVGSQVASVGSINANNSYELEPQKQGSLWFWCVVVALIATLAFLGFRFTRMERKPFFEEVDGFKIIDESD